MNIDPANLDYQHTHHLLMSTILPRPIAFVSTIGENGVFNIAPFSCCSPVAVKPPLIGLGIGARRDGSLKDTILNIEYAREFVIAIVTEALAEKMNQASAEYASDLDEFKEVGLTPVKADVVKAPLVAESPVNLECRVVQILNFGEPVRQTHYVIGEVIRAHIKDDLYIDYDYVEMYKLKAVGRLGAELFCRTTDIFKMERPFIL